MVEKQKKTGLIVTMISLAVVMITAGALALNSGQDKLVTVPAKQETFVDTPGATSSPNQDGNSPDNTVIPKPAGPSVDPMTLSSLDVEPFGVTVYYTKGIPGFDFAVKRTADETQYADFSSEDLVGTKCTNDAGIFASIIKNPASSGIQTTISHTVIVGSDTYGLSLAGISCTSNVELLEKYQFGFVNGFSNLKALE